MAVLRLLNFAHFRMAWFLGFVCDGRHSAFVMKKWCLERAMGASRGPSASLRAGSSTPRGTSLREVPCSAQDDTLDRSWFGPCRERRGKPRLYHNFILDAQH